MTTGTDYLPLATPGTSLRVERTRKAATNGSRISRWCNSRSKRIFDLVGAVSLLILAAPLMLLALLVVATTPGPLLFAGVRLGQGGKPIRVLKFRTMVHRKSVGLLLTRKGDARITKVGYFLRQWKLDELPQLLNVIRGEMSLVGPRPDAEEFMSALPNGLRRVLTLKPGLTSVATLRFRNEEDLLRRVPHHQLTSYYVQTLLPEKVRLDLEYASRANLFTDCLLLLKTVSAILL